MSSTRDVAEFKKYLLDLIINDLPGTLVELTNALPEGGVRHIEVQQLRAKYNQANKDNRAGKLTTDEHRIEKDRIRSSTFELIRELCEDDFRASTPAKPDVGGGDVGAMCCIVYPVVCPSGRPQCAKSGWQSRKMQFSMILNWMKMFG